MDDIGMEVVIDSFIRQDKNKFEEILIRKGYIQNPLIGLAEALKIIADRIETDITGVGSDNQST